MADYRFQREARTPNSEVYNIFDGDRTVGRIDIHFTSAHIHGSLSIIESMTTGDVEEIIEMVDEELVSSADAERSDFIVTVYQGHLLGIYSDEDFTDDEEESPTANGS